MIIIKIKENSLAEQIGLSVGDRLLKINGKRVVDYLDYEFRIAEENITLDFQMDGKLNQIIIEKDYDDDLGVEFKEMKIRKCGNDCVFCFVDQNPKNMREGIYFRDGDYRMSYLFGHYITMTNMGKNELKRIVEQRFSPLYISVHATDIELRKELLLYKPKNDNLIQKINYLIDNDIELHGQIVLIPGKNDGLHLYKTISDIYHFYPKFKSMSIVPVGLTKHREGLPALSSVNKDYAQTMFKEFHLLENKFPSSDKNPFLILSDEWYILADKPFPKKEYYGDYELVENGVGQFRNFLDQFDNDKLKFPKKFKRETKISIITGELSYDIFIDKIEPILNNIDNLEVSFFKIKNNFFGESVTVAGLLTGKDIIEQLSDKDLGESVWASYRILNDEQTLTLDDMKLSDISNALGTNFNVSKDSILDIIENTYNEI